MPDQNNDYRVVVFGAGGVGKTSLVLRFVKGTFREQYIPTIEDTYRQVISCSKQVCTLLITDTTGSHQFPAMQKLSMSKGHAFVLVFSVTSKQSLEELKPIHTDLLRTKSNLDEVPVILIANKCDESLREVSMQEGQAFAKKLNCAYIESSAKTNSNVKEAFEQLLALEKRRNISLAPAPDTQKMTTKRRLKNSCLIM